MSEPNHPFFSASLAAILLALMLAGCRPETQSWAPHSDVRQLPEKAQQQIQEYLTQYCGTAADPKLLGNDRVSRQHLLHGQAVFMKYCAQCHGATGDGAGVAAPYLNPRPRDYRRGVFKFTSTPYGAKPVRDDLVRVVRNGAIGTAMPSFTLLSEPDLQAVVDYVLVLTHRGELENELALEAKEEDEIDPDNVPMYVERIVERWAEAGSQIVTPASPFIPYSEESVKIGEQAFLTDTAGCFKCHGKDGRGEIIPNAENVAGGPPVRSADLTSSMFHGGNRPIDIYRRISAGINGTPMPGFGEQFKSDPATIWHLVNYVQYISSARRRALEAEEANRLGARATPGEQAVPSDP